MCKNWDYAEISKVKLGKLGGTSLYSYNANLIKTFASTSPFGGICSSPNPEESDYYPIFLHQISRCLAEHFLLLAVLKNINVKEKEAGNDPLNYLDDNGL